MTDKIPGLSIAATISSGPDSIEILNSECFCISLDTKALKQALESEIGQPGLFDLIQQRCPYLFATRPVFVSQANIAHRVSCGIAGLSGRNLRGVCAHCEP